MLTSKALGGFVLYLLSHGLIKGGLFLCAGIVLHRLQRIGESHLHGCGRGMWFTAALFILGAWGLAGSAPFGTLLGESMISDAAKDVHRSWLMYVFMFVEIVTAAAVLRATFRIFFGWGKPAPVDEASQIEERPETTKEPRETPAVMFVPAAILILLGIAIGAFPQLRSFAAAGAYLFTDGSSYAHAVLNNIQAVAPARKPAAALTWSIVRSSIAGAIALLLALGSVFREKLGSAQKIVSSLELGSGALRRIHSGHPGDYVAWLSFGTAVLGGFFVWFLR